MAAQALVNGVYGFDDITERASCIITIMSFCLIQVSLYRNSITGTSSNGRKKEVAVYNGYNYGQAFTVMY